MSAAPIDKAHHVAFSVIDLQRSVQFYGMLGYEVALKWVAADKSLEIVHLIGPGELCIELFAYASNRSELPLELEVANNLTQLGIKHLGVQVNDLKAARASLTNMSDIEVTEIKNGRTLVDYFFVRDPNGVWLEIVEDHRMLSAREPMTIQAQ